MIEISTIDIVAVIVFATSWILYSVILTRLAGSGRTLSSAMDIQRRQWMRTMMHRDLRMIDTGIMSGLQNGTAFFASTSLLAIGGCFAMLNSADHVYGVMRDLAIVEAIPKGLFEAKVVGLMLIFGYAFFKFGWSYRLFNYCTILFGGLPMVSHMNDRAEAERAADQVVRMNIIAAKNFNEGLRAIFLSIGYLGWFVNAYMFMGGTLLVVIILTRRQFFSDARHAISDTTLP